LVLEITMTFFLLVFVVCVFVFWGKEKKKRRVSTASLIFVTFCCVVVRCFVLISTC